MVDVHAGIDDGDDTGTANSKTVLCILKPDNLCRWLNHVTVPGDNAVIIHRSVIVESGGDAGERRLWDGEESIRLNTDNAQEGLHERDRAVNQVVEQVVGGRYQKGLANRAVQRALNLAFEEIAKIEDGGQTARAPDDVATLGRRRLWRAERKNDQRDNEGDAFHIFQPLRGSPTDEFLSLLARLNAVLVSRGSFSAPIVRMCLPVQTRFPAGLVLPYQSCRAR